MNKKILALVIFVVIMVGYGTFYAYEFLYVIPEDVKFFKDELSSIEDGIIPESDINNMEAFANQIQNSPPMNTIPPEERKKIANDMRNDSAPMNSAEKELDYDLTGNQQIALKYDLLLKGNVAKDVRDVYSMQMIYLTENMDKINQKIPTDIENGDNIALANDYREMAKLSREFNALSALAKEKLQNIINNLEG